MYEILLWRKTNTQSWETVGFQKTHRHVLPDFFAKEQARNGFGIFWERWPFQVQNNDIIYIIYVYSIMIVNNDIL